MVIIFTEYSMMNLKNMLNGKNYYQYKKEYIIELLEYIKILKSMPYIGKRLYKSKFYDMRQLIFRHHKIIYQIQGIKIYIHLIIHNSTNLEDFKNKL